MYDVDFLARSGEDSSSSYDAITIRFKAPTDTEQVVIVIDGGFSEDGNEVVNHLAEHYGTDHVNLMISTHPDRDHINGLVTAIQQLDVDELLIHQPDLYRDDLSGFQNLDTLNDLIAYAVDGGTTITTPETGLTRFDDRLIILGPNLDYYKEKLAEQLDPEVMASFTRSSTGLSFLRESITNLFDRAMSVLPIETLGDDGTTHPRNNSSVITLLSIFDKNLMFTGDAGIPALELACDEYENWFGSFEEKPLQFFQAPHHGSKHNLGKGILDRILGQHGAPYSDDFTVFISSSKKSSKHPSPKITNAIMRRGCPPSRLGVTQGFTKWHHHNSPAREGWSSITPYPILPEED